MVFIEDVANRLAALLVRRDIHAAVVVVAADDIRDRGVALKAHGVLDALRDQRRTDKTACAKLAHANALREISVLIGQRHLSARIAHIGIVDRDQIAQIPLHRIIGVAGCGCGKRNILQGGCGTRLGGGAGGGSGGCRCAGGGACCGTGGARLGLRCGGGDGVLRHTAGILCQRLGTSLADFFITRIDVGGRGQLLAAVCGKDVGRHNGVYAEHHGYQRYTRNNDQRFFVFNKFRKVHIIKSVYNSINPLYCTVLLCYYTTYCFVNQAFEPFVPNLTLF